MTRDGDSLLAERLSAFEDPRDDSDWEDVLRRTLEPSSAQERPLRKRRVLLIAAAFAALALAIGVALATTLGGFSGWLSGKPGSPATPTEQLAFQRANARSWAAFPTGTKLRRLIVTRSNGSIFRLFGFRAGDEICLRLTVDGSDRGALMSCIPRLELVKAKAPAAAVLVDAPAGKARYELTGRRIGGSRQRVRIRSGLVSFGVTADGVSIVELQVGRRNEHALVANNAFLFIRPNLLYSGVAVNRISAIDSGNQRAAIPFKPPFRGVLSISRPKVLPLGPTRIERKPPHRSISWVSRREPRGLSLRQAGVPRYWLYGVHLGIHFARVLQPDPGNHVRVVISVVGRRNAICTATITAARGGGGGCVGLRDYPLAPSVSFELGGEQSALISGIASDAISSIDLFLIDGERWPVPFRDNAFVVLAPRVDFPAKLVGYDSQGKVVAIEDLRAI
jgi:hypothetical protein